MSNSISEKSDFEFFGTNFEIQPSHTHTEGKFRRICVSHNQKCRFQTNKKHTKSFGNDEEVKEFGENKSRFSFEMQRFVFSRIKERWQIMSKPSNFRSKRNRFTSGINALAQHFITVNSQKDVKLYKVFFHKSRKIWSNSS